MHRRKMVPQHFAALVCSGYPKCSTPTLSVPCKQSYHTHNSPVRTRRAFLVYEKYRIATLHATVAAQVRIRAYCSEIRWKPLNDKSGPHFPQFRQYFPNHLETIQFLYSQHCLYRLSYDQTIDNYQRYFILIFILQNFSQILISNFMTLASQKLTIFCEL